MPMSRRVCAALLAVLAAVGGTAAAEDVFTDLVDAAKRGDDNAVRRILERDPDAIRATDADGYTALHWAGIRAHWRIFAELVAAGAPVDAVGGDGGAPLHWACHHDRADMAQLLLDAGATLDIHNRWGRTPLHVAARRGCRNVAGLLLEHGADPNAATAEGWTPLHVASRSGQPELVALLLTHGADPERRDDHGLRPAEVAMTRPETVPLDPARLEDYVGLYDLGRGTTVKIWREGSSLGIREFAPDGLDPIGPDAFFCRQEPWRVTFIRGPQGRVAAVELKFLRRTVRAERSSAPRYVGSRVCRDCHRGAEHGHQDVKWLQSRHAHAYWRLAADWALYLGRLRPQYNDLTDPRTDDRCLLCHIAGAQNPDSLYADTFRREEGVSCEACHGPGSEYADPEVMADRARFLAAGGILPDERTCRSCHRAGDRFDFKAMWSKIAHPNPAPVVRGEGASGSTPSGD